LRVIGCNRYDFLLQVRDDERLLYWYHLFDNGKQQLHHLHHQQQGNHMYTGSNSSGFGTILLPLDDLSMTGVSAMNTFGHPTGLVDEIENMPQGHLQPVTEDEEEEDEEASSPPAKPAPTPPPLLLPGNARSDSDQTLFLDMDSSLNQIQNQVDISSFPSPPSRRPSYTQVGTRQESDPNFLSPMQYYNRNQQQLQQQQQQQQLLFQFQIMNPALDGRRGGLDATEMSDQGSTMDHRQPWDSEHPLDSMELSLPPSRNPSTSTNPFVRRQQQQQFHQQQQQQQQYL
jgi:hypothetical protein